MLVHIARPANTRIDGARVSFFSSVLLVSGIGLTVFGIQQANTWSWTSAATLTTIGVGVALSTVFVLTQLRSRNPLVDVRLFRRPGFTGDAAVMGLTQFGMLAIILFSSIYLQELLGFSPMSSGLGVLPLILPIAVGAQIAGRWYDRSGVRPAVLTGLATATVGISVWAASLPELTSGYSCPE